MTKRRFIEVDFPIRAVGEHSAREKNIRHGHISTLHIWWARRPLAASRASIYAALIAEPKDEEERLRKSQFIADLCRWENSLNPRFIEKARREILEANGGRPPRVLDCFAGGGNIALEALRLGCETHALDLNPVAVLILKATLEYPQRWGQGDGETGRRGDGETGPWVLPGMGMERQVSNPLVEDVRRWGRWVLEEARKELAEFYPAEPDGSIPVGYIWARTVRCQNPECGAEIPLMRQFWLAKKPKKKVALRPVVVQGSKRAGEQGGRGEVQFEVVEGQEIDFDPAAGTVRRAKVTCPVCGAGMDAKTLRREFRQGRSGQRMVAVVLHHPKRTGKTYRVATDADVEVFRRAEAALQERLNKSPAVHVGAERPKGAEAPSDAGSLLQQAWPAQPEGLPLGSLSPVPDELLPEGGRRRFDTCRLPLYGMKRWGDLFNPRQKLALITFVDKVRRAHEQMLAAGYEPEYARAVVTYLAFALNRLATSVCVLARWRSDNLSIERAFDRQALPMIWDYGEVNPFSGSRGEWDLDFLLKVIRHTLQTSFTPAQVNQGTATRLPYPDDHFDAVVTDPPYYGNVPYADLSDFFYVWLKRTVGHLYPDLFATPLTPKSQEIVFDGHRQGGQKEAKAFFERMLTEAFREIHRVLKREGIAVIVFAHKSTEAWETIIQSLLRAGLVLTASWPVHTEMKARVRAQETASLASSIYMVCRKRVEEKVAYFHEIRPAIEGRIRERLEHFWNAGIGGADFFISAIGPAVEVFGQYSKVERLSGEEVTVKELLELFGGCNGNFSIHLCLLKFNCAGKGGNLCVSNLLGHIGMNSFLLDYHAVYQLGVFC